MSNITSKIFGLASMAALFAGMSFGQNFGACTGPTLNVPPILDRFEGNTELVSDITLSCPAGTNLAQGAVTVTMNEPVTSRPLNTATPPLTDAVLLIRDATVPANSQIVPGTVVNNQIFFQGVNFPAEAYTVTFSNIRVNASLAPNGSSNFAITESVFVINQGVAIYNLAATTVGYVVTGFSTPVLTPGFNFGFPVNYVLCTANPVTSASTPASLQSFSISMNTLFGGALKSLTQTQNYAAPAPPLNITNGENGSFQSLPGYGVADHGTRIQLTFGNLAVGQTIYLPLTVTATNDANVVLTLTASATGPFSALASNAPTTSPGLAATYAFTSTTGTVTAVYEATKADNLIQQENLAFTGGITASQNFQSTATTPVTVTVALAPQAGTGVADIPRFTSNYAPLNLSSFALCQTTLLFPFVAAGGGFDTGIAIVNTGLDPNSGKSTAASGTPGACTFSFYGTGTPSPATAVTVPAAAGFPATIAPGSYGAFSLAGNSVAPNFVGYIIAQCGFLYGHGFGYITYQNGMPQATTEGYLAEVIGNNRSPAVVGRGPEPVTF